MFLMVFWFFRSMDLRWVELPPPTGALLSRLIGRSQNQCLFSGHPSGLPCLVRPVGSVMGEPTSWTSPGHPFLAHVPGQIANRERHITRSQDVAWAGSVLLRCWLESCSSANPVSGLRSTPTGRDGQYVLATTGVRREGGGRRYSMCYSIPPVPKIQRN